MDEQSMDKRLIVGVGSALVDMLIYASDEFLQQMGAAKGGMLLVDKPFIDEAIFTSGETPQAVPGGSACNTIVGLARLGNETSFVGKLGDDPTGRLFSEGMTASGVLPILSFGSAATGNVLSIITPDAQRSMFTFLGSSSEMCASDISPGLFEPATIVHVEGYLLYDPELFVKVLRTVHDSGARVSLDLASYTVVKEHRDLLLEMCSKCVDVLLANEDEAGVLSGESGEEAVFSYLRTLSPVVGLKLGARGSLISSGDEQAMVEALAGSDILDTTGAGDLWAAGFLHGLIRGWPLKECGELASACGLQVCRVLGAAIPDEGYETIGEQFELDRRFPVDGT